MNQPIYKNKIIYQIYPLSFCDSNNDGYGDINGIISKLDYLKDLGVGLIWISPLYKSKMRDNGYDISDYYSINPLFGTMEDFDNLILEAKKRDIDIVMDLVINHTSSDHQRFKEALKDPKSKYRNYYIFKKGNGKKPPNNWTSAFTGSAWSKVSGEDNVYYFHLYDKEQPDLNYRNEEVIEEIENILKFYLDKGVVGFRCDVINQIYKSSFKNGKIRFYSIGREYYESQDQNFVILKRFQDEVLKKYNAFFVGETSNVTPKTGNKFLSTGALNMFFEFEHVSTDAHKLIPIFKKKFKPSNLINIILKWQEAVPWIGVYLENHDQRRSLSRFGNEKNFYRESGKALCMFLLTLKGTPFIYQGEEIGMVDDKDFSYKDLNDRLTLSVVETAKKVLKISTEKAFKYVNETVNRDHARSPMQWDESINAGFNKGHETWLKMNYSYKEGIDVLDESLDADSILIFYKKMIKIRNDSDILKYGTFKRINTNKNVAKFLREYEGKSYLVVINLSCKKIKEHKLSKKIVLSNYNKIDENYLLPYQGVIYEY